MLLKNQFHQLTAAFCNCLFSKQKLSEFSKLFGFSDTEVMREAKGLRNRYNDLDKNITLREDAIKEMIEIMRQYQDRNRDLQTQLDWSRPVKAKLQEPIPTIKDVATLQLLIDEHRVSLGSSFKFERNTL